MGLNFSAQINLALIEYLKSLKINEEVSFGMKKYDKEFFLNGSPGSPKCKILAQNLIVKLPEDLIEVNPEAFLTLNSALKAPKIEIIIGEAAIDCDELGFFARILGKIEIYDAYIILHCTPRFDDGYRIGDCDLKVKVDKVQSDIQLFLNENNYSGIVNAFLTSDNPIIFEYIVNAILVLKKEEIKKLINTHLTSLVF